MFRLCTTGIPSERNKWKNTRQNREINLKTENEWVLSFSERENISLWLMEKLSQTRLKDHNVLVTNIWLSGPHWPNKKKGFSLPLSKKASCDYHRNTLTYVTSIMNKKTVGVSTCKYLTKVLFLCFDTPLTSQHLSGQDIYPIYRHYTWALACCQILCLQ